MKSSPVQPYPNSSECNDLLRDVDSALNRSFYRLASDSKLLYQPDLDNSGVDSEGDFSNRWLIVLPLESPRFLWGPIPLGAKTSYAVVGGLLLPFSNDSDSPVFEPDRSIYMGIFGERYQEPLRQIIEPVASRHTKGLRVELESDKPFFPFPIQTR